MQSAACDPDGYSQWHSACSHRIRLQAVMLSEKRGRLVPFLKDLGVDCTVTSKGA
jgi:hypothetical protein